MVKMSFLERVQLAPPDPAKVAAAVAKGANAAVVSAEPPSLGVALQVGGAGYLDADPAHS